MAFLDNKFEGELLTYIGNIEVLPSEEITAMVVEYKKTKDKELLDKIIEQQMKLIVKIAKKYTKVNTGRYDICDLIQEGVLGVMRAVNKFDPDNADSNLFSTYSTHWIRSFIGRFTNKADFAFNGSDNSLYTMKRYFAYLRDRTDDSPVTAEEISKELNISLVLATSVINIAPYDIYIDSEIHEENNTDGTTLGDILLKDNDIYELIEENDLNNWIVGIMKKHLSQKEFDIISKRFGFNGECKTLQEIGDEYGISRERIRQLEVRGINKLRRYYYCRGLNYHDCI